MKQIPPVEHKEEDKFLPTVEELQNWFIYLNDKYFDGALAPIKICFRNMAATMGEYVVVDDGKQRYIALTNRYVTTEHGWKNVLIHELVHYYIDSVEKINEMHGPVFHDIAEEINQIGEFKVEDTDSTVGWELRKGHYVILIIHSVLHENWIASISEKNMKDMHLMFGHILKKWPKEFTEASLCPIAFITKSVRYDDWRKSTGKKVFIRKITPLELSEIVRTYEGVIDFSECEK